MKKDDAKLNEQEHAHLAPKTYAINDQSHKAIDQNCALQIITHLSRSQCNHFY